MRKRYGHLAFTIARYLTTAFALGVLVGLVSQDAALSDCDFYVAEDE